MYLKRAEEEDKRTVEGWKEEADKVFLFVSVCLPCRTSARSRVIDWFILRRRRVFDHNVNSRHSSEPTGHIQLLPRKYPVSAY
jgi:hypothetical protein